MTVAAPDWRAEAAARLQDVIDHGDDNGTIANLTADELRDVVALAGHRLRAALAIHQPDHLGDCNQCLAKADNAVPWPCGTARALGVES